MLLASANSALLGFTAQYALRPTTGVRALAIMGDAPVVDFSGAPKLQQDGTFEGYNAEGNKIVTDGNQNNYRKLSDKLQEADIERRLELEEIEKRENAVQFAREARDRKIALLRDIPDDVKAGTVDDFMFKEGVKDILAKLDYDLIGLKPVKERVREIASLLVASHATLLVAMPRCWLPGDRTRVARREKPPNSLPPYQLRCKTAWQFKIFI